MAQLQRERFLVAEKEAGLLSHVAARLRSDPEVEVLDVVGPVDQPNTLVVAMTPEHARQLKQEFTGKLIIEKDAPLSLS